MINSILAKHPDLFRRIARRLLLVGGLGYVFLAGAAIVTFVVGIPTLDRNTGMLMSQRDEGLQLLAFGGVFAIPPAIAWFILASLRRAKI